MVIAYPGISYLKGYERGDPFRKFAEGYGFGKGLRDEEEAPEAFAAYLDSLIGDGAATGQQQAAPTDRLVAGSHMAADAAADPMLTAFFDSTRMRESGGNDTAQNPNSTARGRYQFLEGTWADLAKRHPELGLTPDGRDDPEQQERAIRVFTQENARALRGAGVPVNPGTLYAAHFLGAGAAPKVLQGDPNSPVSAYVDPGVIEANPQLADMTVAQFTEWAGGSGRNASGGYQPPMATQPAAASGLPPREVMQRLFANPVTRPLAIELAKSAAAGVVPKPVEINGQLVDPTTGKILGDYRDPETAKLTDDQRELAQINAERQAAGQPAVTMEQYLAAKGGGGMSVTLPDGTVVQQGGKGLKLTEAQGKDVGFYTRGLEANSQLVSMDQQLTNLTGQMAGLIPLGLGNYLRTPEFRQAKVAADNFLAAILRKDTGAAITNQEFELYGPMFLPIPGDDPGTIQQKARMREVALIAIRSGLGTAEAVASANEMVIGRTVPSETIDPAADQVGEGTIIENDAGERMILRNGQWEPFNG